MDENLSTLWRGLDMISPLFRYENSGKFHSGEIIIISGEIIIQPLTDT